MSALVELREGAARASSVVVADCFGKRHADVIRAVRGLQKARPDLERNFALMVQDVAIGSGAKRPSQYYEMDRKGFVLLVMGFTGPKAMEWKIAFYDAFDQMEARLAEREDVPALPATAANDSGSFIERCRHEPPTVQLALVREIRHVKGRAAAARIITLLGWDVNESPVLALPDWAMQIEGVGEVVAWLNARCDRVDGARVRSDTLYDDFVAWGGGACRVNWGRIMTRIGFPNYKSGITFRVGLMLKP